MGHLRFGKDETVTCIVDVDVTVGAHQPACLAYKFSTYWVGAGVYLKDDGYVLRTRTDGNSYYELPPGAAERTLEGLPHPFPAYSIPVGHYLGGYSLWLVLIVMIAWWAGVRWMRKRKQAAFVARQAATPVRRGPPRLDTRGDRFVYETVKGLLAPGESIQHQAYATSWDYSGEQEGMGAYFLALTSQRLFVVTTRRAGLGIVYESESVEATERSEIVDAQVAHGHVLFVSTSDGLQRGYCIKPAKDLSNQEAFLLDVSRLLHESARDRTAPARATAA